MANICFTVLHYRTPFIYALSAELVSRGHSVYFLSPSPKWTNWLLDKGVSSDHILDQSLSVSDVALSKEEELQFSELADVESLNELTLNNIILMDRLLKEWPGDKAYNYLIRLYPMLKKFIIDNKIDLVIGEATPANELLTSAVCRYLNIPYYFPITVRVPDGRFAFFEGRFHSSWAINKNFDQRSCEDLQLQAKIFLEDFAQKKPKPMYWYKNNKLPILRIDWFYKFFKNVYEEITCGRKDPTRFDLAWLLKKRISEVWNRFRIRSIEFVEPKLSESDEQFVLFPLHKQPESSVDVLGDYYSDQLNLIRQIVRSLPVGYKLYVKEHSNAIGDRSVSFYKQIAKLPNTKLVSPYCESFGLMLRSSVVISISGTMAYEAGLLGKPAITFSKMFFCNLPSVEYCPSIRELQGLLNRQIKYKELESDVRVKEEFAISLFANSFEGVFADVYSYPEIVDSKNVDFVCDAVESIV